VGLSRESILRYCRIVGWCLALGVVGAGGLAAMSAEQAARHEVERGLANKRAFLSSVRACVHNPAHPRPWAACELEVRAAQ
jgi:hypothetical protein